MSERNITRQLEVHYINTGFPYSATESFMDFFEGLLYTPPHHPPHHHQEVEETANWSYYKYGYSTSAPASSSYNFRHSGPLFLEDVHAPAWPRPAMPTNPSHSSPPLNPSPTLPLEDCVQEMQYTMHTMAPQGGQMYWQNNINPDNMTYEELLDLGDAVGTQNKGLSQDLIAKLPVTKYKRSFFSRKKNRCVICQMDFKRKDSQMTLPCKHIYHDKCIKKWLGINKACPICYVEVTGEGSRG